MITDIENASKEQKLGIEQINDAIISLDHQTQENVIISNKTQDVSNETNDITKLIIKRADEKADRRAVNSRLQAKAVNTNIKEADE